MGESLDVKSKSRKEELVSKEESKRSRGREHEKERDRDKEKNGEKERRKDRESRRSERERSVDDKHRERDREKHRDKHKDREKERKKEREDREGEKERERDREKAKEKEREEREKEREKEREREREKVRERERERREREREKEKERERMRREREREREREEREKEKERARRRREAESDGSGDERRDRDRKRRRRDDDYKERDRERSKSRDPEKNRSQRHRADSADSQRKKSDDEPDKQEKLEAVEQDVEEEQRKLDEEMEKRRRRVQEWQELRRKKEEEERQQMGESNAEEPKVGKNWTLEGESDDDEAALEGKADADMDVDGVSKPSNEAGDTMAVDSEDGNVTTNAAAATEEVEIDPLDAFMNSMVLPEVEKLNSVVLDAEHTESNGRDKNSEQSNGEVSKKTSKTSLGRIMPDEDFDFIYEDEEDGGTNAEEEDDDEFQKRVKKTKAEKLTLVDHSKIDYIDFRKNFYMVVKEIARMTPEEVAAYRKELELKVHGKDVPKPIKTWHQTGLTTKILDVIRKMNFEKPMPIQAQAFPVIMSGRDCIGIAKTGSGKTLAFVLPMLRHIKDQPPLMSGDGPIGLIMAPTRELVQQIHNDIKKFAKVMNLTCVPVYGGSGVAQQIGDLKKGAEIVVCTPGRMIDVLCTSSGKITNLRRVTFLVVDEADRMFDLGFEPQITRIVQNIRPDRQTVLFSATFPRQVEVLAKKVLNRPVEIQVGGRSVVNSDITQMVEVRPESDRFLRLLELLGEWYEKGKILIFVHSQDKCDNLFKDLLKSGYPCLSLHGGKDQGDRESTLADFKSNVCNLLVATSVAARGLDVKDLELVVNFDVPNHYEDYVHRVGRTGRAGNKGHAITFISEDEAKYAPDLLKALELSRQPVPQDLKALADGFMAKVKQGLEQNHASGYGGVGYKFDEQEDEARKAAKKAQAKEYGYEYDKSDSEDEDDEIRKRTDVTIPNSNLGGQGQPDNTGLPVSAQGMVPASILSINAADDPARAVAVAAAMRLPQSIAKLQQYAMPEHYEAELEINDFPQNARWKVTHKETLGPISDWTGAAITTRGQYYPPGKIAGPGERKLYLFIEGRSEHSVKSAKAELKKVLEDITAQAISLPGGTQPGRYSIV